MWRDVGYVLGIRAWYLPPARERYHGILRGVTVTYGRQGLASLARVQLPHTPPNTPASGRNHWHILMGCVVRDKGR